MYLYYHQIRCLYLKEVACMDEPTGNYYQTSQLTYGGLDRLLVDCFACFSAKKPLKNIIMCDFPSTKRQADKVSRDIMNSVV